MKNLLIVLFIAVTSFSCTSINKEILTEETPWGIMNFSIPNFKNVEFRITEHGAKEENENNQSFIQEAINTCSQNGGGKVVIPKGLWKTSYIELKENVNLYLEEGAVLSFLDDISLYSIPTFTRWEGIECMNYHPFIYAKNVDNIAITGTGKIDGNGKNWWPLSKQGQKKSLSKLYDMVEAGVEPKKRNCLEFDPMSYLRPSLIQFINCTNVLLEDYEIGSGPMWTNHLVYCENVVARNLKVITVGHNNDGIVPDACKNVLIDNCYFSTGDDCIVIKSGLNEDGWRVGKSSENIVIKNCTTKMGNGGVVIGSEMSGGVRNVYAHDCYFHYTSRGLRVKSMKGRGGIVENLYFDNITMDSIYNEAIKINLHYGSSSIKPRSDSLPTFRNFNFKNIKCSYARHAIWIKGINEHPITGMSFLNLDLKAKRGMIINDLKNSSFDSVNVEVLIEIPLQITSLKNLSFNNINLKSSLDTMVVVTGNCENINIKNSNKETFGTLQITENSQP